MSVVDRTRPSGPPRPADPGPPPPAESGPPRSVDAGPPPSPARRRGSPAPPRRPNGPRHAAATLGRNRRFRLLWAGSGLSILAERFSAMAFTLVVLWSTGSKRDAGLVSFAALLPALLVQLPAGVLVDRWNRHRVMVGCVVIRLAGIVTVTAAVATGHVWVPHLAAVAFVQGSMTVFYQLAERATVRAVVETRHLPAAMARNEARGRAANFVGQPLGTALYGLVSWVPFVSSAALYLISLGTLVRLRGLPHERPTGPRRSIFSGAADGFVWVWRQTYFRIALLVVAGGNLVFQGLILTLQVVVKEQGRPPSVVGLIMAAGSLGGLAGAFVGGWWVRRLPMRRIMVLAHLLWSAVMPALIVVHHPVGLGALFFTTSLVGVATTVAGMVYQLRITPQRLQGRVGSVAMLLTAGASSFGALGTGFLLESVSTARAFAIMSGAMVLLALITVVVFTGRRAAAADIGVAPDAG